MKSLIHIVIDGLGFGSPDGSSSTMGSILHAESPGRSKTFELLRTLYGRPFSKPGVYGDYLYPSYKGADSYRGHYEMIGINVNSNPVYVGDCLKELSEILNYKKIKAIFPGLYLIDNKFWISNNVEAEPGGAINIIAHPDMCSWVNLQKYARDISKTLKCDRVIAMTSQQVPHEFSERHMGSLHNENGDEIHGIIPSRANIYGKDYRSAHIGRSLDSYTQVNLLTELLSNGKSIAIIGKVTGIFGLKHPNVRNFPCSSTQSTYKFIEKERTNRTDHIFANFQQVDLMGHQQDPEKSCKALFDVCTYIDKILQSKGKEELLLITADHGNDPDSVSPKHTVEKVPLIIAGNYGCKVTNKLDDLSFVRRIVEDQLLFKKTN